MMRNTWLMIDKHHYLLICMIKITINGDLYIYKSYWENIEELIEVFVASVYSKMFSQYV